MGGGLFTLFTLLASLNYTSDPLPKQRTQRTIRAGNDVAVCFRMHKF